MFGIGSVELLVLAIAALLFVGPKELPTAMRAVGRFVGKVRAYTRHFTAGIDAVVREAELEEMEKQWKAQNEAIMAEFPSDMYAETMLPKRDGGEEGATDEDRPASAPRPKAGPDGEPELP